MHFRCSAWDLSLHMNTREVTCTRWPRQNFHSDTVFSPILFRAIPVCSMVYLPLTSYPDHHYPHVNWWLRFDFFKIEECEEWSSKCFFTKTCQMTNVTLCTKSFLCNLGILVKHSDMHNRFGHIKRLEQEHLGQTLIATAKPSTIPKKWRTLSTSIKSIASEMVQEV